MGRKIDFSQPLTADELAYVNDRPWLRHDAELQGFEVLTEDDEFTVETDDETEDDGAGDGDADDEADEAGDDEEEEDDESYSDWNVDQLKEELKTRELPVSGSKEQLVQRLEESDAE